MSTRLYVGNLSFNTPEDILQEAFSQYGQVAEVKIMFDRETGRPRGFGFVSMADAEEARRAIEGLNNTELDGRVIRVNEAEERRERPRSAGGGFGGGGRGGFGGGGRGGDRGGDRGGFGGGGGGRGGRGGDRGGGGGRGGRGGDRGGW